MKKKLVFVIPSLSAGGGEKSLVNLLNSIDYSKYEVDLILLHSSGIFLKSLPKEVLLVNLNEEYYLFTLPLIQSVHEFLKQFKLRLALNRFNFFLINKLYKNEAVAEQKSWKYLKTFIRPIEKKYDSAIGFLEKTSIYLTVDCIDADKKIGWIHTTYSNSGMDKNFDDYYFNKLNHIVTVSDECESDLILNFPQYRNKISIVNNIVSQSLIRKMANEVVFCEKFNNLKNSIITVARLSSEKGIDLALSACKILVDKGTDLCWYIIGDGHERKKIEKKISVLGLKDRFILLGLQENPYYFVDKCTLYVQPSRYEGKSIAVDEAKILQKPIVITDFSSAVDQIKHFENGIICEMNANSIADSILNLLHDKKLQNQFSIYLSAEKIGTEKEIFKFYELING